MELTELQEIINRHGKNLKQEVGLALSEQEAKDIIKYVVSEVFSLHVVGKPKGELLNVSFNVGDKVEFDGKKAVVLWTSVRYLDIEIVGTNKILQGVNTSLVLPR